MNTRHKWVATRALASRFAPAIAFPALAALALAGCTSNATDGSAKIAVTITDDACALSATDAPAGDAVFTVTNSGSKVAEFYVYGADGTTIVAEVENVGPGLSRDLVVTLDAGAYVTSCDPGMDGDDIRDGFTATGDGQAAASTGE